MNPNSDDIVDPIATENPDVAVEAEQAQEGGEGQPTPPEKPEGEEGKGPDKSDGDEDKQRKSRATKRVQDALARAAQAEQKLAEYESRQNTPPPSERPQLESFDSYDEYQDALEAYQLDKAEKRVLEKLNSEKAQKSQVEAQAEYETAVADLQDDGLDVQALTEKAESLPPLPVQLNQFGLSTKETLRLAAALIQDEDLYFDLSQMNAVQAARRIGQEIDKMAAKPSAPKVTKAPPPLKPVKANAAAARSEDSMSDSEFLAHRRKMRLKG